MPLLRSVLLLALVAGLLVAAPGSAGPGAASAPRPYCGAPSAVDGQPTAVVIVVDGSSSSEPESGASYPIPVRRPRAGVPVVRSYCPVAPNGRATRWPAGLRIGLRTWAKQGNPAQNQSPTSACVPAAGRLDTSRCLVAGLADAGAVVLPYSYAGAKVRSTPRGAIFHFTGYDAADTQQPPAASVRRLGALVRSVLRAWPRTSVFVVAHSLGGMVAEGWWRRAKQSRSWSPRVRHVFTLDAPINGVPNCRLAAFVVGAPAAAEFCHRRRHRDALDRRRIRLSRDSTFTAVATPHDPTYLLAGGNLRNQGVYSCPDPGNDPRSRCLASPPTLVSASDQCDPTRPGIDDDGHHLVIECPPVVTRITATVRRHVPGR